MEIPGSASVRFGLTNPHSISSTSLNLHVAYVSVDSNQDHFLNAAKTVITSATGLYLKLNMTTRKHCSSYSSRSYLSKTTKCIVSLCIS